MKSVLRISEAATIGLHAMCCLVEAAQEHPVSASTIASELRVSEAHLSKVLQRLGRSSLVSSRRGPGGGFFLARPTDQITLADIYRAVEGPLPEGECLLGRSECALGPCILGTLLRDIQVRVTDYLEETTIQDLLDRKAPARPIRARMTAGAE